MKCDLKLEKNLKGYTNIVVTTPQGTALLVQLVCKDKVVLKKLIYKLTCEYLEDNKKNNTK